MYLSLNGYQDRTVSISRPNSIKFLFVGVAWRTKFAKERWIHETNCWPAFWHAAAHIKKREDQLRRTTRDLVTRVAKCIELEGRIFVRLLWNISRYSDSLQAGRSGDRTPMGARYSTHVQTGPRAYPASYKMRTGSSPAVKQPGRGVEHPPYLLPKVKVKVQLYLYSPSGP
jgi:hypothetical protein